MPVTAQHKTDYIAAVQDAVDAIDTLATAWTAILAAHAAAFGDLEGREHEGFYNALNGVGPVARQLAGYMHNSGLKLLFQNDPRPDSRVGDPVANITASLG